MTVDWDIRKSYAELGLPPWGREDFRSYRAVILEKVDVLT